MSIQAQEPVYGGGMPQQQMQQPQMGMGMPQQQMQQPQMGMGMPQQPMNPQMGMGQQGIPQGMGIPQQPEQQSAQPQMGMSQPQNMGIPQPEQQQFGMPQGMSNTNTNLPNNFIDNNPIVKPEAAQQNMTMPQQQNMNPQMGMQQQQQQMNPQMGMPQQQMNPQMGMQQQFGMPGQQQMQQPAPGSTAPGYSNQPYIDNANLGLRSPTGHPFKEKFQGTGVIVFFEAKTSSKGSRYARGLINVTPNEPKSKNYNFMCFSKTSAHMLDMLTDPNYMGQSRLEREQDGSIKKKYIKIVFNGSWEIDDWQMKKNQENADQSKNQEPVKLMIDDFYFELDPGFKQLAENYVPTPPPSPMDMLNGGMMNMGMMNQQMQQPQMNPQMGGMPQGLPQGMNQPQMNPQMGMGQPQMNPQMGMSQPQGMPQMGMSQPQMNPQMGMSQPQMNPQMGMGQPQGMPQQQYGMPQGMGMPGQN